MLKVKTAESQQLTVEKLKIKQLTLKFCTVGRQWDAELKAVNGNELIVFQTNVLLSHSQTIQCINH